MICAWLNGAEPVCPLPNFGLPPAPELRPPRGLRLRGARRAYRALPRELGIEDLAGERVRVRFELGTGSYATVLLEELFGPLCEQPDVS